MYNWIDGRKFSNSKSLLTFGLTSKHLNPFSKNGFESNSFSQLPVIKEEEGFLSEDEVELPQKLIQSTLLKNNCVRQSANNATNSNGYLKSLEKKQDAKLVTKLPPLVNINCLMNTEVKQTQAIWKTSFGKRLISKKNIDENLDSSSDIKKISSNYTKNNNKFGDYQFSKFTSKRKCTQEQNIRLGGGDKMDVKQIKTDIRRPKKIKKNDQNFFKKKLGQEKNIMEKESESQLSKKFQETTSHELLKEVETVSSFSKKQKFLTECVKSIIDCYSTPVTCEYCNKKLPDIEHFNAHKKQHEAEKEICLLCDKEFYNSKKFIQHLLTHESVDQFSCKKCKKYFPNLKKYEQHCRDSHSILPDNITDKSSPYSEFVEGQLPKLECKQCKLGFESKKAQKDHKKHHHTKNDLAGIYLLNYKNV